MADIDYSGIEPQPAPSAKGSYRPPPHVYFGKRGEDGMMEPEPVYTYQAFPSMRYGLVAGKVSARLVKSQGEAQALGEGWTDSPGKLGMVTAPSFDQFQAAKAEELAKAEAPEDGRRRKLALPA